MPKRGGSNKKNHLSQGKRIIRIPSRLAIEQTIWRTTTAKQRRRRRKKNAKLKRF